LARALDSLLAADRPDQLDVRVTVVDNRSTDDTRATVESYLARFDGRLQYLYEPTPGRSHALNTGIAATDGDLVGMIDDDEEVERGWLRTIAAAFADEATDFIGGPYVPRWGAERPAWLGTAYRGAIGWVDAGPAIQQFGPGCDAMLMGGNAVIRRPVLERVGPYSADLGRTPGGACCRAKTKTCSRGCWRLGPGGSIAPTS
jgi:glucosyl-dolichyl phosphate glucuronosyltransferase